MYVKRVRRKCGVRKCKNINSYAISKTAEAGNSVIICADCLKEALGVINGAEIKNNPPELKAVSDVSDISDDLKENIFKCSGCGKEYATEAGLKRHKCKSVE